MLNKSSDISVIMAVYALDNYQHLDSALESIWNKQTLKPYEIVLVQDGILPSTTLSIISKWELKLEDKLIIYRNPLNLGLTKSLNIAIGLTSCPFIARMDADDISTDTRFEDQINYLFRNPNVDVVGSYLQEFNEQGNLPIIRSYPERHLDICKIIHRSSPICHASTMFRRRIFDEGNYYNEKYRTSQDIELWFRLIEKGYVLGNINKVLYLARLNNDFYERRSFKKGWKEFKIYWAGIIQLSGYSPKLLFPIFRLVSRLLPGSVVKLMYYSKFRSIFNH